MASPSDLAAAQSENLSGPAASSPPSDFTIFTSIRCDPILETSSDNVGYSSRRRCKLYFPELHRQRLLEAAAAFWPNVKFKELESTASFETALLDELDEKERMHETYICPMKVKYSFTSTGRTHVELAPVPALPLEALFPTTFRLPSLHSTSSKKSRFGGPSLSSPYTPYPSNPPCSLSRRGSDDYFSIHSTSTSSTVSSSASSRSGSSSTHGPRTTLACTYEIWIDIQPTEQTAHTRFKTSSRAQYDAARARALPNPEDVTQEVLLWNPSGFITEGSLLTPYFYRNRRWVTPPVVDPQYGGGQAGTSRRWALEQGLCEEAAVERRSIRVGERVWVSNGVRGFGWGKIQGMKQSDEESERSF
ncbi:uncharacterized protein PV09_06452 [Verruconis gallopava]|uniref:Aminotransferase class IV n=1 Tax=Verruconis gallopava TaxID=253628 RepID=A0A0D2A6U2_9PEZI|nr:uncharacterized protein PV09_06452 [Verruconis gallopava]KIW02305.1 hypothetical protein PV09_06452 [Verruconis gallopava]